MNWQAIGAIGEVVGGLAVIFSLVYLAFQVRQSTRQMFESSRDAHLNAIGVTLQGFSRWRALLSNSENAELWIRGCQSYSSLSEAEQLQFRCLIEELFFTYQALHQRMQESVYDNEPWNRQRESLAAILVTPGGTEWWNARGGLCDPVFAAELEEAASTIRQSGSDAA